MGAIKDLTDLTVKLIDSAKDRKYAGELREIQRMVASLQSEHADIHEKCIALMTENAELKQKVASLELQLAESKRRASTQAAQASEFVEHKGALFKRKPDGGFHEAVYCPNCKRSAGVLDNAVPYSCSCGWLSTFTPSELFGILKKLAAG